MRVNEDILKRLLNWHLGEISWVFFNQVANRSLSFEPIIHIALTFSLSRVWTKGHTCEFIFSCHVYFIDNRINAFLGPLIKLLEALFRAIMAGIVCRFFLLQMFISFSSQCFGKYWHRGMVVSSCRVGSVPFCPWEGQMTCLRSGRARGHPVGCYPSFNFGQQCLTLKFFCINLIWWYFFSWRNHEKFLIY